MLAEAAVEQDTAVLPQQYQTNYREEYQYNGLQAGPYVPGFHAITLCCMLATPLFQCNWAAQHSYAMVLLSLLYSHSSVARCISLILASCQSA